MSVKKKAIDKGNKPQAVYLAIYTVELKKHTMLCINFTVEVNMMDI